MTRPGIMTAHCRLSTREASSGFFACCAVGEDLRDGRDEIALGLLRWLNYAAEVPSSSLAIYKSQLEAGSEPSTNLVSLDFTESSSLSFKDS